MKVLAALALTFFLSTFGIVVGHNVVHHEDEPALVLPTGGPATTVRPAPARLPMTLGATATALAADGRAASGRLSGGERDGAARTDAAHRRVAVAVRAPKGGAGAWYALLGSDVTVQRGAADRADAVLVMSGVAWKGTLDAGGGTAGVEVRLQAEDGDGKVLGEVTLLEERADGTDRRSLARTDGAGTLRLTLEEPGVVRAYLYVKVDAADGGAVDFGDPAAGDEVSGTGVSYGAIAVAVGQAPPPTTVPPAVTGITAAELAQHATEQSCWLLIQGRVYDVTAFLRRHPGSQLPVLKWCGKEATQAFLTQDGRGSRHSYEAADKLGEFFVGEYAG